MGKLRKHCVEAKSKIGRGSQESGAVVKHLPEVNQVMGSVSGMERDKGQKERQREGGREGGMEGRMEERKRGQREERRQV